MKYTLYHGWAFGMPWVFTTTSNSAVSSLEKMVISMYWYKHFCRKASEIPCLFSDSLPITLQSLPPTCFISMQSRITGYFYILHLLVASNVSITYYCLKILFCIQNLYHQQGIMNLIPDNLFCINMFLSLLLFVCSVTSGSLWLLGL